MFLGSLSIQCKIRCNRINRVTLGDQPVDAINLLATSGLFQCLKLHLRLVRILKILPQVLCSQPLLKDSLSL